MFPPVQAFRSAGGRVSAFQFFFHWVSLELRYQILTTEYQLNTSQDNTGFMISKQFLDRRKGPGTLPFTLFVVCLLVLVRPFSCHGAFSRSMEERALESFELIDCLTPEQFSYNKDLVSSLDYSRQYVFNAFCLLDAIEPEEAIEILRRLVWIRVNFDHLALFDNFFYQDTVTAEQGWQLLKLLDGLKYAPSRALIGLKNIQPVSLEEIRAIVERVRQLDEAGHWAAKAVILLPDQTPSDMIRGLDILLGMDEHQRWAAESFCLMKEAAVGSFFQATDFISFLPDSDARNARALFQLKSITPESAFSWLTSYFAFDLWEEESRYFILQKEEKATLLKAYNKASDYLIWKINNLHDVTDRHGQEIGSRRLSASSTARLSQLYHRLAANVRSRFNHRWQEALQQKSKSKLISTLRRATTVARSQAAKDLTSANIYILLSRGSELYDSSFRNILVPVLKKRIKKNLGDNLLRFLLAVDPQNHFISDFIISLAQKGKLATFFPKKVEEQKKVLDLVAQSAFQDEHSLVLFSATFMKLLRIIESPTRSYLIDTMLGFIENKKSIFIIQLRVILQYYLQEYPSLLSARDKAAIIEMIGRYGAIELSRFTQTAFKEWKKDGRLQSLSIFQSDDDGRKSFYSNCRTLMNQGYRPQLSTEYSLMSRDGSLYNRSYKVLQTVRRQPGKGLTSLYRLMVRRPIVVDWVKRVNGIEIAHSVFIYQGEVTQQKLLEQFIKKGHEMFAQRGHSYWRKEQLLDPISELVKSGSISDQDIMSKQRFMSIGSCGGIRVYSELNHLFNNNVDILATIGSGKSIINNPYNQQFFEIIAKSPNNISWKEVAAKTFHIFRRGLGEEYLQPGCLPAILHKIMDRKKHKKDGTSQNDSA